ncbi:MAG: outer membrane lipoprotein-sorting protein [Pseudomonadota bacterium]
MSADAAPPDPSAETGLAVRTARFIVATRWLWVVASLVLVTVAAARLDAIWPPDPSARIFFAPENPDRQALDRFEERFAKDDNVMFVMTPAGGDVFAPEVLKAIGDLTERAWRLPLVRRVNSVTNFPYTAADGDDLVVRDLVPEPAAVTPDQAATIRDIALDRIEIVDNLVNAEGTVTQVSVLFSLPGTDPANEVPAIVAEVRPLVAEIEAAYPGLDIRLSGGVMINNQFAVSGQEDSANLLGPMFLVILLIVGLALRSVLATVAVLVVILLSAVTGLGALGWLGTPLNSVTVLAPLYIMTLAVAAAVHILVSARRTMVETADRREWMRRALTEHMGAIIIACVTTAVGFLSLNFSISPPFRQLGTIVAAGILAALFFTLTLLPALVTLLPIGRKTSPPAVGTVMERFGGWVARHHRVLLPSMTAVAVLCAAGISQLKLEDDFLRYFDERYEFRQDTDYTEANLTGVNLLEFALPAGETQGINNPDFLAEVAEFAIWLRSRPEVTAVRTLTDTVARLNMNMNGDNPAFLRLPETRDEASQFLFLYELSLGYGMDLTDQIDIDRSAMRLTAAMAGVTTADMRIVTLEAGEWLAENAPIISAAWETEHPELPLVTPTGVVHVFNLISYRDVRAMLTGTVIALVLISGIIMLALRDVRIGLISLVPNLLPAAMAFGLWGYGVGNVTLAIAVVLAATLGIVVDDTVHFLSKYARARRRGDSAEEAVRYAFSTVGMALVVTTVGLFAGFAVLAQSGFSVNGDLAKLTAITIVIALIADFLLLPSLLIWLDKRRPSMSVRPAAALMLAVVLVPGLPLAETPEEKGRAIAIASDTRDTGWGSYRVDGEMVLRDRSGNESRRAFENLVYERADPAVGDMGVIVFSRPRDIRGTGLLTHSQIEPTDDDQWLYLPAVKRVKRISSSNRTGKFVSSEFSYEDLGSQEVDDYDYKWLRDETCPGAADLTCHVVESYPRNAKSGYSKRLAWSDVGEHRLYRVEFHNRRGDLEKVLTQEGFADYAGFWRPALMRMENLQTGKSTDLIWTNYDFGADLPESDFVQNRLPRLAR